ncbi:MAG TPA: tetratricopeptide repeat protein [Deltaproteobacteria bacterium]|nr:tetratricopeptide repeat protein [Deltaproteobacteria bacterium]HPP79625.1 tetratricopeptide repeat protein [Deltaproteobacteria bacterium]
MKRHLLAILVVVVATMVVPGCSKSPEEKRNAYLESARSYENEGKLAEAAIQYQNALQIAPDDAATLVSLGEVQLKLNRPQEAYASFAKAAKTDPKNVKSREYMASMLLLSKRYDLAQKEAEAIIAIDPKHTLAREIRAQALFMSGNRDEGVRTMEELLKTEKPTEEMYLNTIQMYMAVGRTDDALTLVDRGAALFPSSTKLRFMASDIHSMRKDAAKARRWAEEAYRVSNGSVSAGVALAMFYARNNMDELYKNQLKELMARHPKNPEPYLLEATVYHTKGDLDGALASARKARSIEDTAQVRVLISQLLLEKKQPGEAKAILKESIQKDGQDFMARIMLAQILLDEKNPTEALEVLDEPIKKIPTSPDLAATASQAYLLKGDVQKARQLVEKALAASPQNVALTRMMAKILYVQGDSKAALDQTRTLVGKQVKTPDILYIGALSALREGRLDEAKSYVDELDKHAPETWPTLHAHILWHLQRKEAKAAFPYAERAVEKEPGNEEALALYASLAPKTIGLAKTVEKVRSLCSKKETSTCHMVLALLVEQAGNKDEALAEIKKAIALDPGRTSSYHALAQYYTRNNMTRKAIDEYEAILNKNPNDLAAASMIALLQQDAGDLEAAKKAYRYVLDRDPKHGFAANNLAWILAQKGSKKDLDEALRLAQIAKDRYPDDPRVADTLGFVYLGKGMAEAALGQFQMALDKMPEEPTLLYHKAQALAGMGRTADAVSSLKKALSSAKPFPEKREAQELLARLSQKAGTK